MEAKETRSEIESQNSAMPFLLKEYETLLMLRQDYIRMGDNRFNFFLLILSGATVFVTWINSSEPVGVDRTVVVLMTGIVGAGVLLLGLSTFARIARRNSSIVVYTRGMTSIRRYFVELYPEITEYMVLPTTAGKTRFRAFKLSEQLPVMLSIINGLIAGAAVLLIAIDLTSLADALISGLVVAIILVISQYSYYARHMEIRRRGIERLAESEEPTV